MDRTRGYAHRVDVRAPPEAVWQALTDVQQVALWYVPRVRIDARAGGRYWVQGADAWGRDAHIDVFDAPRRLRLIYLPDADLPASDRNSAGDADTVAAAVPVDDFLIVGQGEITVLRLLGSGLPPGVAWDAYFMRLRLGWEQALRRLKTLLERPAAAAAIRPAAEQWLQWPPRGA